MTVLQRLFLESLAREPKGRVGYKLTDYEKAMTHLSDLVERGFVRERPCHPHPKGFQITDAGRAYLAGDPEDA